MNFWDAVSADIAAHTLPGFYIEEKQSVAGGSINAAYRVNGNEQTFFVKSNRAEGLAMFEAEAAGLQEINSSQTIKVPQAICHGVADGRSYIVLEHIDFSHSGTDPVLLAQQLAAMHRCTAAQFGWQRDNTIGSTLQVNTPEQDWITFWREHRLGFQLALARDNGYGRQLSGLGEQLMSRLESLLQNYHPEASLLHGDLWSGNYGFDAVGTPVIFDPAVYYGDREADIAMTELFGGFPAQFYEAYNDAWPLDDGYRQRKILYNLYHILNHLNLFGSGYLGQSVSMMERLLAA